MKQELITRIRCILDFMEESDLRNYVGLLLGDKKEEDDELPF